MSCLLLLASLTGGDTVSAGGVAAAAALGLLLLVALNGFLVVQPNQAKVAVFLGRYMGTVRRSGFHSVNPLTTRRTLSLRIRNLDTDVRSTPGCGGSPTPPRSPPTCSAVSRPTRSWPPAGGSSRGRWAWSTTPSAA